MRLFRNFTVSALALAALALLPRSADAALLTINDGGDVWALNVQDACSTCAVTLSVTYSATSPRLTTHLQGVQWGLTSPSVTPTSIGFNATTAGTTSNWGFAFGVVSNGGCNGNANGDACGQWVGPGAGFTVAAGTYSWTFLSTFANTLPPLVTGNIRAAYDLDPDGNGPLGRNFSPNGGRFGPSCTTDCTTTIPEPASMLLFGLGSIVTASRVRRRASR